MRKIPDRRAANVGEKFMWRGIEHTVQHRGEMKAGRWFCISCAVGLAHNAEKDSHCNESRRRGTRTQPGGPEASGEQAKHVLAWLSVDSGNFEVP